MGMFKNKEISFEKRLEIVFYKNNGKSYRKIACIIGCSRNAAFNICKKYHRTRAVKNLPRVGRPKKFVTPRDDRSLLRELGNNSSVGEVRQGMGSGRLGRCYFSDEYRFGLQNDAGRLRVWRKGEEKDDPNYYKPVFMRAPSVMVWGCMVWNIDATKYCDLIDKNLPSSIKKCFGDKDHPIIFQQDNARPHSAKFTMIYFQLRSILRLTWPSQSPDLNPIENVWSYMKRKLNKDPPKNKTDLVQKIFKVWEDVPVVFLQRLYDSMQARLNAVIQ
eukprot:gene13578-14986_t